MSRITLLAVQALALAAVNTNASKATVVVKANDPQNDDQFSAACYSGSQKPAPHSMTRRQYKTLVLPRRSRKSKRR